MCRSSSTMDKLFSRLSTTGCSTCRTGWYGVGMGSPINSKRCHSEQTFQDITMPTDLPPPDDPSQHPRASRREEQDSGNDTQMHVIGLMVGTALMFIGFLNVFLSISGGFEINVVPLLIYFGGLAVWANAVIETPSLRYAVMASAIALALGFFHYGEVLFWHKQVVFWATVVIVMYFMFNEPKKPV